MGSVTDSCPFPDRQKPRTMVRQKPKSEDGWTYYGPPEHEKFAGILAAAVAAFVQDCRDFAHVARAVKLDQVYERFGVTWEEFCIQQLRQPADVVEAIIVGVEVLGEQIPVPAETAKRVGGAVIRSQALAADPMTTALPGHGGKRTARELACDPSITPVKPHGNGKQANNGSLPSHGNTAEYLVRRLKRDAPEIAAALGRGEYRSARAAAIAAGIKRVPTALEACLRAWRKLTPEERQRFRETTDAEAAAHAMTH